MAGLILKLSPNERVLINGIVMENGDRKATLKIKTPDASILRLRDALHPDDVNTPVSRAYYAAQLVVAGSASADDGVSAVKPLLEALSAVFKSTEHEAVAESAIEALRKRNFYQLMRALKPLLEVEKTMLDKDLIQPSVDPSLANAPRWTMEARI